MRSFKDDEKWQEAKRAVGAENSWLEVISYYRSIGGKNVFVYSVIEGDKRLIVDVLDDDSVLLVNRHKEPVIDSYENVTNSRKIFKYSEDLLELSTIVMSPKTFKVFIERHN